MLKSGRYEAFGEMAFRGDTGDAVERWLSAQTFANRFDERATYEGEASEAVWGPLQVRVNRSEWTRGCGRRPARSPRDVTRILRC